MKPQETAMKRMLRQDCILLFLFLLATLGINVFVLIQTLAIVDSGGLRVAITAVFAVTMLVLTGAIVWVGRHLSRNRDEVYGDDLHYQQLIRQQKEGDRA